MTQDIKKYATDMILKYPTLKDMIIDLYSLCMTEIEEGGSEQNEFNLFQRDVEELIEEMIK
jgi:hypothetical protein